MAESAFYICTKNTYFNKTGPGLGIHRPLINYRQWRSIIYAHQSFTAAENLKFVELFRHFWTLCYPRE